MTDLGKVLVVMPTYNEADNIEPIVQRLQIALPQVDLLIVDDNSPDGSGQIADNLSAADGSLHVLHRPGKQGLASAYLEGFGWGLDRDYGVIIEMDADGSHQPEELPTLLDALTEADMVKGSRWMRGGSVVNWQKKREWLSRGANIWVQAVLDIPVHDSTGGFNLYRASILRQIDLSSIVVTGYAFQIDMTRRVLEAGGVVREVPIQFQERLSGQSKMNPAIIGEALQQTLVWGFKRRTAQVNRFLAAIWKEVKPLTDKIQAQAARGFRLPD